MPALTTFSTSAPANDVRPDYDKLIAAEKRHFWFRARNRVIARVVGQLTAPLTPGYRVLEVGCGTGNVLRVLEQTCVHGEVTGLELFAEGLGHARQRTRCRLIQADIHAMPLQEQFELIGMFDVLEHLPDDARVLRDLYKHLSPGGCLVLTVPAHMELWSYFDENSGHYRRYTADQLTQVLSGAGFHVEYATQFLMALYPLMWLGRRWAALRRSKTADAVQENWNLAYKELRVVPVVNTLLSWALAWEPAFIGRRRSLPLGTSILAIARKPNLETGLGHPTS